MSPVLGIDIGASSVKSALVASDADDWRIEERLPTIEIHTRTFDELRAAVIATATRALASASTLSAAGISTTGSASRDGIVISSGFYSGYAGVDWSDILRSASGGRIERTHVLNDGRASAYGCYLADDRARGRDLVHFVIGTGIGGGMVTGGQLFHGSHNFAGAYGHIKVDPGETARCVCGGTGCVELYAAAPAVVRHALALGVPLSFEDGRGVRELGERATGGDESAREAFRAAGRWLGIAIGSVANVCDPEMVTVGGGVVAAARDGSGGNWYVDAAAAVAPRQVIPRIAEHLTVVEASLLNDAALIGAAALSVRLRSLPGTAASARSASVGAGGQSPVPTGG